MILKAKEKSRQRETTHPVPSEHLGQCRPGPALRLSEVAVREAGKTCPSKDPGLFQTLLDKYKGFPLQPSNWVLIFKKASQENMVPSTEHVPSAPDHSSLDCVHLHSLPCYGQALRVSRQAQPLLLPPVSLANCSVCSAARSHLKLPAFSETRNSPLLGFEKPEPYDTGGIRTPAVR